MEPVLLSNRAARSSMLCDPRFSLSLLQPTNTTSNKTRLPVTDGIILFPFILFWPFTVGVSSGAWRRAWCDWYGRPLAG